MDKSFNVYVHLGEWTYLKERCVDFIRACRMSEFYYRHPITIVQNE